MEPSSLTDPEVGPDAARASNGATAGVLPGSPAGSAGRPGGRDGRRGWPGRVGNAQAVFWLPTLLVAACAMVRQRELFRVSVYPASDFAINSVQIMQAEQFHLLVGNYSRVGFHHPGPALLYMQAAGEALFYKILHAVPTPYNGQLLATSLYVAAFLGLATLSIYRITRSRGAAALAFGVIFLFAARLELFGNNWFPYLYVSAFLLFAVAAAGVAAGVTTEVPLYVLAAGVLVHGHVSFIMYVTVTTLVAGGGWWLRHRGAVRGEARSHRTGLIGSGVILAAFLLPMVVEVVRHFPGQWGLYWHYIVSGQHEARTWRQIMDFLGQYWTDTHVWVGWFVAAAATAAVLTVTERNGERRRRFAWLYAMVVLQSVLTIYYIARGVDTINSETAYVGFFYQTIPWILIVAVICQAWIRLRGWAAARFPTMPGLVGASPALVTASALVVLAAAGPGFVTKPAAPSDGFREVVEVLQTNPARAGRPVGLVQERASWPVGAGVAAQLQRAGVPWCVDQTGYPWEVFYPGHGCPPDGDVWAVHASASAPHGADILWHGMVVNQPLAVYTLPGNA